MKFTTGDLVRLTDVIYDPPATRCGQSDSDKNFYGIVIKPSAGKPVDYLVMIGHNVEWFFPHELEKV
jgi:hypothetical protein